MNERMKVREKQTEKREEEKGERVKKGEISSTTDRDG